MNSEWRQKAACKGATDLFFIRRSESPQESKERADKARAVCACCPVSEECLNEALVNRELFGVWGGTTERQRRKIGYTIPERECPRCRRTFQPSNRIVRYCSDRCRDAVHAAASKASYRLHATHDPYPKWSDTAITLDRERSA